MNYFEEAKSISGMLKMRKMTQSQLAKMLSVSQPYIANKIRLLAFSQEVRDRILSAGLTERHARTLLRLKGDELNRAIDTVIGGKMTTAETELLVDRILEGKKKEVKREYDSPIERLHALEESIEEQLSEFRRFGVSARAKRESFEGKFYINICIG